MKLILASASPRRAEIFRDAGIPFTVLSSAVDETPLPGETASDLVRRLAAAKAELVAARAVGPAIVIAADTVVALDGTILGKPRTSQDARNMLEKLSARTHSVITGVAWSVCQTGSAANSPKSPKCISLRCRMKKS
jgi:septum formation protein